jgi:sulfide:quinone oxidoreductase
MASRTTYRVLIAGGGVAALETLLGLKALAADLVDVQLVAAEASFSYRPLAVTEPFAAGRPDAFDLAELTERIGARFAQGTIAAVDTAVRTARTADGDEYPYDALVVATGARAEEAIAGALTFRGSADAEALGRLLTAADERGLERIAFAVPGGVAWPLPAYELALLASARAHAAGSRISIAVVTPEAAPLQIFGREASDAVARLLADREIYVFTARYPIRFADRELRVAPGGAVPADAVVALPRLAGPDIAGLPKAAGGFIPTDRFGRVRGVEAVYAAGDATDFAVKQGGIAAQQADAAAASLVADAGVAVVPQPFTPVLRGLLLTGDTPAYLRTELVGRDGYAQVVSAEPLWWPPAKIVGRHLAPFLAAAAGTDLETPPTNGHAVEVDLAHLQAGGGPIARAR